MSLGGLKFSKYRIPCYVLNIKVTATPTFSALRFMQLVLLGLLGSLE